MTRVGATFPKAFAVAKAPNSGLGSYPSSKLAAGSVFERAARIQVLGVDCQGRYHLEHVRRRLIRVLEGSDEEDQMRLPRVRELILAGIIYNRLFAAYPRAAIRVFGPGTWYILPLARPGLGTFPLREYVLRRRLAETISASILQCHHSGRGPHRFSQAVRFKEGAWPLTLTAIKKDKDHAPSKFSNTNILLVYTTVVFFMTHSSLSTFLDIPLHNPYGRNIYLPPLHHIKDRSPNKDSPKHDNIPIHRIRLHRRSRREEAKHKESHQEHQCDDIDCHPRTA